jgi:hypothetical protein
MRLDDPARPFASPGVRALLIDGGYVPHLTMIPKSELETKVIVGLRDYDSGALYSYVYKSIFVPTADIPQMLAQYYLDPEATLKFYWDWEPKTVYRRTTAPRYNPVPPTPETADLFDLL